MTDKQIANIIDDMTIIIDTREKNNNHIISWLESENIKYKTEKLDSGDYSFILPNYNKLKLDRLFLVEKKNSLDEIASNFSKHRERFINEFERVPINAKMHIVIENASWTKIKNKSWRSLLTSSSMCASIITWSIRYKCSIWFVEKQNSPKLIYDLLKYELMEFLKSNND